MNNHRRSTDAGKLKSAAHRRTIADGAIRALLAGLVVVATCCAVSATSAARPPDSGCASDRRTEVYSSGVIRSTPGTFTPCAFDTGMPTGHAGLAIGADDTLLRSVVTGPTSIAVSTDHGSTWTRRALPAGAGDTATDSWLDSVTGRYFLTALGGPMYSTDDNGKTWATGTFDSDQRNDWPRIFTGRPVVARPNGYPTNTYYCNWTIPAGVVDTTRCFKSVDGGHTFTTAGPDITPDNCPGFLPSVAHGRGVVDPRDGTIYLPAESCGELNVYVSHDEGGSWTRRPVPATATAPYSSLGVLTDTAGSQPFLHQELSGRINPTSGQMISTEIVDSLRLDATGRLYALWIDKYRPHLATSTDAGRTWTSPVDIAPPGVDLTTMASLAITPQGQLGASYYGSTDNGATWNGYLTVSADPTTATPTFQTATITPPETPIMNEPCCWAASMQEYTSARWSSDGSLYASFATSTPTAPATGVVGRLTPIR